MVVVGVLLGSSSSTAGSSRGAVSGVLLLLRRRIDGVPRFSLPRHPPGRRHDGMTRNLHGHLLRGRDLRVGLADHPSNRPLEDGVAEGAALEEEPEPMETTRRSSTPAARGNSYLLWRTWVMAAAVGLPMAATPADAAAMAVRPSTERTAVAVAPPAHVAAQTSRRRKAKQRRDGVTQRGVAEHPLQRRPLHRPTPEQRRHPPPPSTAAPPSLPEARRHERQCDCRRVPRLPIAPFKSGLPLLCAISAMSPPVPTPPCPMSAPIRRLL
uniref:Uncharacterized protein n=1 Tax=Oryza rufipogon TaxID=4529 RepID=A0A0E0NWJ5_ORYRU